jgi:hypothetical protein
LNCAYRADFPCLLRKWRKLAARCSRFRGQLRIPLTNGPPAAAGFPLGASFVVRADPGFASGGQTISAALRLWGVEGNALYRAYGTLGPRLTFGASYQF